MVHGDGSATSKRRSGESRGRRDEGGLGEGGSGETIGCKAGLSNEWGAHLSEEGREKKTLVDGRVSIASCL